MKDEDEDFNRIVKIIEAQMESIEKHLHLTDINNILDKNNIELI